MFVFSWLNSWDYTLRTKRHFCCEIWFVASFEKPLHAGETLKTWSFSPLDEEPGPKAGLFEGLIGGTFV